jgi:hypothetical protein
LQAQLRAGLPKAAIRKQIAEIDKAFGITFTFRMPH